MLRGIIEIDLVGPDTEAPDDNKVLGLLEDICGEPGLGADPNGMDITIVIILPCQLHHELKLEKTAMTPSPHRP